MKHHTYRVTVTHLEDSNGNPTMGSSLSFNTTNHDEVLHIVGLIQQAKLLPAEESASFAVGLKLFGETLLKNRDDELFKAHWPHFLTFMKTLKASLKQSET